MGVLAVGESFLTRRGGDWEIFVVEGSEAGILPARVWGWGDDDFVGLGRLASGEGPGEGAACSAVGGFDD